MTKTEVEEQWLGDYVVMPTCLEMAFKVWWRSLEPSHTVDIRYPHARHGNAGKTSHSAKTAIRNDFLTFEDMNSQVNGRNADATGPTLYFLPMFTTIQMLKAGSSHYAECLRRSVVGEFNRALVEARQVKCSNGSSHNWPKKHQAKRAICPHMEDYCDTCAGTIEKINAKQTSINRLQQAAATEAEEHKQLEDDLKALRWSLENHRVKPAQDTSISWKLRTHVSTQGC